MLAAPYLTENLSVVPFSFNAHIIYKVWMGFRVINTFK